MAKYKFDVGQKVRVVRNDSPFWWWEGEVTQQLDLGGSQVFYRIAVRTPIPVLPGDGAIKQLLLFREDYLAFAD